MSALKYAEIFDSYRVVPRCILCAFAYLIWYVVRWFTGLDEPTTQQTAFVSTIVGITAPITAFYFNTGRKWTSIE